RRLPGHRSMYDMRGSVHMRAPAPAAVHMHEIAHWMEHASPELLARSAAFLDRRTQGEVAVPLPGGGTAKPDQFFDAYCGRLYRSGGATYATEILAMGIERFAFDPVRFAAEDPDYFDFIFDTL